MRTLRAFMIGVGAAYLFDPSEGKRRRRVLVDRLAKAARKVVRFMSKKARFYAGKSRGLAAGVPRAGSAPATDDATVLQRIRSDAFRDSGVSTKDVDVVVDAGVAKLRGSVSNPSLADDLVDRVRKVPGVRDVEAAIDVSSSTT
jgi:osmotically-inducible protein OsmY